MVVGKDYFRMDYFFSCASSDYMAVGCISFPDVILSDPKIHRMIHCVDDVGERGEKTRLDVIPSKRCIR